MKVFIRHIGKGTFRRVKGTFLIFFRVNFKYVMCTKKMAFITQIGQRKYLCSGKLCFLNKCTLRKKKNVFFWNMTSDNYIGLRQRKGSEEI